jgi:hypothetical protein
LAELGQSGAIWDTGLALSDKAQLVVNGEPVGEAILKSYQGHLAIVVR